MLGSVLKLRRDMSPVRSQSQMPSEFLRHFWGANLLDDVFNNSLMPFWNSMRTDIKETEHAFLLEVDMPGFSKENIQVEYHEGILTITARVDEDHQEKDYQLIRQERRLGRMSRSYHLDGIDEDQIQAVYRDGVLRLLVPKSSDNNNYRKQIDIQ